MNPSRDASKYQIHFTVSASNLTMHVQTLATQKAKDVILLVAGDTFVGTTW
jgi:diphthamide biosynthesis methyltransferase